ncbi:unnamed protein product [Diamesa serratosioi]
MKHFALFICVLVSISSICASKVQLLNEDNWTDLLKGEWMVEFYAPWCPACKNMEAVWDDYGSWANDLSIKVAKIDVVLSPGLSGRFFVTALPTIFHVIDGQFRQYRGSRDMNSFMTFVEEKKWEKIETVQSWKKPDSIPMGILSSFFKLSHFLKELNLTLLKDYGLPVWGSYAIFAIATILLGAVVGLILVCIIDFIWPQKATQRQSFSQVQEQEKNKKTESLMGDELDDDDDDEEDETSDAEKNSGSDSEEPESDQVKESPKASPAGSPDVRKRRTRKAD